MANWLASELLTFVAFALVTWRSFKLLKAGEIDLNLLKTWVLLGLLQVFEEYGEFLVSWVPLYYLGKCSLLLIVLLPESNMASLLFARAVVPGIDGCHHTLNHLVVPNLANAATTLPWMLALVLFPALAEPSVAEAEAVGDRSVDIAGTGDGGSARSLTPTRLAATAAGAGGGAASRLPPSPCQVSRLTASAKKLHFFSDLHHLKMAPAGPPSGRRGSTEAPGTAAAAANASATLDAAQGGDNSRGAGAEKAQLPEALASAEDWEVVALNDPLAAGAVAGISGTPLPSTPAQLRAADCVADSDAAAPPVTPKPGEGLVAFGSAASNRQFRSSGRESTGGLSGFLRRTLTGDANIRVRDHLFDLKTSSPPLPAQLAVTGLMSPGAAGSPGGARRLAARGAPRHSHGGGGGGGRAFRRGYDGYNDGYNGSPAAAAEAAAGAAADGGLDVAAAPGLRQRPKRKAAAAGGGSSRPAVASSTQFAAEGAADGRTSPPGRSSSDEASCSLPSPPDTHHRAGSGIAGDSVGGLGSDRRYMDLAGSGGGGASRGGGGSSREVSGESPAAKLMGWKRADWRHSRSGSSNNSSATAETAEPEAATAAAAGGSAPATGATRSGRSFAQRLRGASRKARGASEQPETSFMADPSTVAAAAAAAAARPQSTRLPSRGSGSNAGGRVLRSSSNDSRDRKDVARNTTLATATVASRGTAARVPSLSPSVSPSPSISPRRVKGMDTTG